MQQDLVVRARTGDHEAFSELASASVGRLYAVTFLILRDRDRAQDAVQEALVSAWKDIGALRDPGAWDAWLHRLAIRACYRQARKERRRTEVELKLVAAPERLHLDDASNPLAAREEMEQELGRLPLDQRTVMVLHFYADLTLEQAAHILDIPIGTAKSRLHRGLRTLRQALGEDSTGPPTQAQVRTA